MLALTGWSESIREICGGILTLAIDSLTRWLVGVQVGSFLVMGGLLVSILLKLK